MIDCIATKQDAERQSFVGSCGLLVVIGVGIRLVLAPFTSTSLDDGVWATSIRHGIQGIGLYSQPGFSYPPVWGYLLHAEGFMLRLMGLSPQSVATSPQLWTVLSARDWQLSPLIMTSLGSFLLKVPLFCSDLIVAWLVWHIVLSLGWGEKKAKLAVALWFLCPLVIFESAVHGAFDTMVALCFAAAILARLRRRYFLAGVAIAIGVLTKLTPGFLAPLFLASCFWPMAEEEKSERWRALGLIVAGGALATLVGIVPLVANGTLHAAYANVFSRSSVSSSVGGLSWLGFSALPQLSSVETWALQPGNPVVNASVLVDVVPAVVAVFLWRRSARSGSVLVALTAGVMALVLLAGPLANSQYLLWVLPAVVVLAVSDRRLLAAYWILTAAGVMYEVAITSPLAFLTPSYLAFGFPSLREIVASPLALTTTIVFGEPIGKLFDFVAFLIAMVGVGITLWSLRKHIASRASAARRGVMRPGSVGLHVLCAGMLGCVLLLGLLPAALDAGAAPLVLSIHVTRSSGHTFKVSWESGRSGLAGLPVNVVITKEPRAVRSVVIYADTSYPSAGSSAFVVQGVVDHLPVDLSADGVHVHARVVDARRLASVLLDSGDAAGTVVVDAAGTLPSTVWGPSANDVSSFLEAGGTLVWGGDEPGYYSVGPATSMVASPPPEGIFNDRCGAYQQSPGAPLAKAVTVMGEDGVARLLGWPGLLPTSWGWGCTARQPSAVAEALGLSSVWIHAGPRVSTLLRIHGVDLGYNVFGRTSAAWIPRGKGGVLLFAGTVNATSFSSDTAALLATSGAQPDITSVQRIGTAGGGSANVRLPAGVCSAKVALVVSDPSQSVFLVHHATTKLCNTAEPAVRRAP